MISPLSVRSLLLWPTIAGNQVATATGFIVLHGNSHYLITNWHVVSGRNPLDGQPAARHGGTPDGLIVAYLLPPAPQQLSWDPRLVPLRGDQDDPLWLEHPEFGRKVDVVALPLTNTQGTQVLPYELDPPERLLRALVSDFVDIIGFPFGRTAGGAVAIWTKGAIASEPEMDFDGLPCFLIDARTRMGQSGSPVVAYSAGGPTTMEDGSLVMLANPFWNLLGVYSGRINSESDLGMVWKPAVIREILEKGVPGNGDLLP
jgi:hypothetical protein